MKVLGIIGGIGSGKSTVSALFQKLGAAVINADEIGHHVLLLPQIKKAALKRWGNTILGTDGNIDRRKLAAIVFANKEELAYLQSLTHPLIAEEVERLRKEYEQAGSQLCLLDAPLLLESGWEQSVDLIVFVSVPDEVRWQRIQNRGWSKAEWQQREAAQLSVEQKQQSADLILDNSGDTEHLHRQVEKLVRGMQ